MTNTASLQFNFQIDPWEQSFLRERNTPAGLGSAHLLIYVKRKPFCRYIIRELQLFEVCACVCSERADLGMLLECEGEKL